MPQFSKNFLCGSSILFYLYCKYGILTIQQFVLFQVPTTIEEWNLIMEKYHSLWNFPNCCGAMDGKHLVIRCPQNTGSEYYNYKHTFSIILFAIVDADYNFLYVDVGTNGRVNDASVFSKSSINEALEKKILNIPTEGVFVADDAFPLRTDILKPYALF